ncbi:MAG TPA: hypothetical protein VFR24_18125 [Candidatus Angelobacter sp.]|nr:hypothetical protein [Candidatus Angelobacter sp.]
MKEIISRKFSKEEIIAAIQACAKRLGRLPTQGELARESGIGGKVFRRLFGNFTNALKASGFDGNGNGFKVSMEELFREWAAMARKLGKMPSIHEYTIGSQYSVAPLRNRFRGWSNVPAGLARYAEGHGLGLEWADVLEMARRYQPHMNRREWMLKPERTAYSYPQILNDRPVYGAAMLPQAMCFAPVNEMGVVFLFGAMAGKLGFIVTYVGTQYPDIEAFREVAPGRWQRVRIEAEYLSRNFVDHHHDPGGCDLIVCWENNWPDAPMEVIALKDCMGAMSGVGKGE